MITIVVASAVPNATQGKKSKSRTNILGRQCAIIPKLSSTETGRRNQDKFSYNEVEHQTPFKLSVVFGRRPVATPTFFARTGAALILQVFNTTLGYSVVLATQPTHNEDAAREKSTAHAKKAYNRNVIIITTIGVGVGVGGVVGGGGGVTGSVGGGGGGVGVGGVVGAP